MARKEEPEGKKKIVGNRRAFHEFTIDEQIEAGIILQGTEVKSLRDGKCSLDEAFARFDGARLILYGLTILPYANGGYSNHVPDRPRQLLLHRREIKKLKEKIDTERLTMVPIELYWRRGYCKVLLGVGKGKKLHDKRQSLREKDDRRTMQRALRGRDRD